MKPPSACARPRRKREQVKIAEGKRAHQRQRLFKLGVGLSREAHHHVRAQGEVRPRSPQQSLHLLRVMPGTVAPVHAAQHGVRARLQRQMRMTRQRPAAKLRHKRDQIGIPVHRLNRAQPKSRQAGPLQAPPFQDLSHQPSQRLRRSTWLREQIASPAAKINAREHQFVAASRDKSFHLAQHGGARQAPRRSTRLRNHAEGAAVAASLLDLQIRPRLLARRQLRFLNKRVRKAVVGPHRRVSVPSPVRSLLRATEGSQSLAIPSQPNADARRPSRSEQSLEQAPCGCCPPRPPPLPSPTTPAERAVHSSQSPRCAPADSADASAG